jgi:hypothetical protein
MSTKKSFTVLLRPEERAALKRMAHDAGRPQSVTVRRLIREAARERGLLPNTNTNDAPSVPRPESVVCR